MNTLPPEWYPQSAIQLTWPHKDSDWASLLEEVTTCFVHIASEISKRQKLIIVCPDISIPKSELKECNQENIIFFQCDSNDTWARDHGGITLFKNGTPTILDFGFNGWAKKYPFEKDNLINAKLFESGIFNKKVQFENHLDFILEGGSIESDGKDTLLTTSSCLLSENRNDGKSKKEIEDHLKEVLGANRILWLHHGYLSGDDTDGHIDTLARFCDENTIVYVKCTDVHDDHYEALQQMENELKSFSTLKGGPYRLVPLPMAEAVYDAGERLPATYANFLILNEAVLLPFYGTKKDLEAKEILQSLFPTREVIGINCSSLIKQGGSLHCLTMQYPQGII